MNERTRIVITGCARSGTKYLAALLQAAGIEATHEALMLRKGMQLDWRAAGVVDVSWETGLAIPPIAKQVRAIGHVIRDPHAVVASLVGRNMIGPGFVERVRERYPEAYEYEAPIDRALAYWIAHNLAIETQAEAAPVLYERIPLERPLPALHALLAAADLDASQLDAAWQATPRDINHREHEPPISYRWGDHDPALQLIAEGMYQRGEVLSA